MSKKFIIAEPCDYVQFPGGGQIQQAKNLMEAYGGQLALVGVITDDSCAVGKWTTRNINGQDYDYFAVRRVGQKHGKTLLPQRISSIYHFWKHRKAIASYAAKNLFIQSPEVYFALYRQAWRSICYRFPGALNPLDSPRYRYGKYLKFIFDKPFFYALKRANCLLASADDHQIENLICRSQGILRKTKIIKYPTRFDDRLYKPLSQIDCRRKLGLSETDIIFIQVGRLSANKGCRFVLHGFELFARDKENAKLYFLGDGEEKESLQQYVQRQKLENKVSFLGHRAKHELVKYLCSANAVIFGSLCKRWCEAWDEGWSVSMVESLGCGKAILTTPVSGAYDMVLEGENGYILQKRDRRELAEKMEKVCKLPIPNKKSIEVAEPWKMSCMKEDFEKHWPIFH